MMKKPPAPILFRQKAEPRHSLLKGQWLFLVLYDFNATLEEKGELPIGNPFASRRQDRRPLYEPEPPARTRHLGSQDEDEARRLWDALPDYEARAKVFGMAFSGVDRGPFFAWEWKKDIDWRRNKVRGWRRKGRGQLIEYWCSGPGSLDSFRV